MTFVWDKESRERTECIVNFLFVEIKVERVVFVISAIGILVDSEKEFINPDLRISWSVTEKIL